MFPPFHRNCSPPKPAVTRFSMCRGCYQPVWGEVVPTWAIWAASDIFTACDLWIWVPRTWHDLCTGRTFSTPEAYFTYRNSSPRPTLLATRPMWQQFLEKMSWWMIPEWLPAALTFVVAACPGLHVMCWARWLTYPCFWTSVLCSFA